ncbi:hypothetical protein [Microbispora amethystogenes]|uniref:Uncharacterized protein n=1 Tax=Microbispora amethystogenes TaxID=1427754 RepID=A0ABQ4FKK5_9ACTN|nr:hypothetical protein [Microbispora amethystogenes]GIH35349.1 hypothetical protein Mam01_55130 [Microbispora amethystogenes]
MAAASAAPNALPQTVPSMGTSSRRALRSSPKAAPKPEPRAAHNGAVTGASGAEKIRQSALTLTATARLTMPTRNFLQTPSQTPETAMSPAGTTITMLEPTTWMLPL